MAGPNLIMQGHLEHVVNSLVNETRGTTDREAIRVVVDEAYEEIASDAKFEQFIPILTMRQARLLLLSREYQSGRRAKEHASVLIICGTNAGRSQVAAALLRFYAPGLLDVVSAGQDPAEGLNEDAVAYMRELGVELTDYPKRLRPEYVEVADYIIFAGSNKAEVPADKDAERWPIPHTTGLDRAALRDAVSMIDSRVRAFIARVLPEAELPPSVLASRASH